MSKKVIHQLSLSDIGGVQRSFDLFFPYAIKKSVFRHYVYGMHDLMDNFMNSKEFYFNLNKSLINKIKFVFFLFSKNYIIHFYNKLGSYSICNLLNIIPSSNIIFHERGSAWNAKNKDIQIYRKNASKAKVIIANSNASKVLLVKRFGIDEKKIQVIYNGFFLENFQFAPQNSNRLSEKFSIGYVGRLDTPKAVHIIIKTAFELSNYDFFIVGKGILETKLKNLAKNSKNINFIGSIKDPLEIISKMDVIVVPSIREPFGNVIVESGFCKKAVIASNIDGIPEIIENETSGILIDPDQELSFDEKLENALPYPDFVVNPITHQLQKPKEIDPFKLKDIIIRLASDRETRKLYGENLYNSVKKKYNIEKYQKEIELVYQKFQN
jgi:glycosyltransferase involved in cell wall biosynthesis